MDMAHKHSYRETSIYIVGGRVNGMCEPDKDGAFSLVRIADNTFKVPNTDLDVLSEEHAANAPSQPEDGE